MKKLIVAVALTTLFSTAVNANSGLADRINEARSFPDKEIQTPNAKTLCMQHKKLHEKMRRNGMEEQPYDKIGRCPK